MPKIEGLSADPRLSGCKKLRGYNYKDLWRVRVGDYRVVYIIDYDHKTVRRASESRDQALVVS